MTDMKTLLLQLLLDRYERSKWFREGISQQRVGIRVSEVPELDACMENADRKKELLETLAELKQAGVLDFSWVRYEKGNLADRIWLRTEPECLPEAYRLAGREPRQEQLDRLDRQISDTLIRLDSEHARKTHDRPAGQGEWTQSFRSLLKEAREEVREKKKIPRFFFPESPWERNEHFLMLLEYICRNEGTGSETMERILSQRLFGDSKYFERELRAKLLQLLRKAAEEDGKNGESDEELLSACGIVRWPEILEFCGRICAELREGAVLDFSEQIYGACLNAETVRHVCRIEEAGRRNGTDPEGGKIRRVLTIENKANYIRYAAEHRRGDELILYHGGFFSPVKGQWFRLIHEAFPDAEYLHWSDIDLGGFRIFRRLQAEVFPEVQPFCMDAGTLLRYEERCMPISDGRAGKAYEKELRAMREEKDYAVFHPVIDVMLEKHIRLEQEALLF